MSQPSMMASISIFDVAEMCDVISPITCQPSVGIDEASEYYDRGDFDYDYAVKRAAAEAEKETLFENPRDFRAPAVPLSTDKVVLLHALWMISIWTSLIAINRVKQMKLVVVLHALFIMLHACNIANVTASGLLFFYEQNMGFQVHDYSYITQARLLLLIIRCSTIAPSVILYLNGIVRFLYRCVGSTLIYTALSSIKLAYFAIFYILIFCVTSIPGGFYIRSVGVCHREELFFCYVDRVKYLRESFFATTILPLISLASYSLILVFFDKRPRKINKNGELNHKYFEILSRQSGLYLAAYHLLFLITNIPISVYVLCGEGCFRNYACVRQWLNKTEGPFVFVAVLTLYVCLQLMLHVPLCMNFPKKCHRKLFELEEMP